MLVALWAILSELLPVNAGSACSRARYCSNTIVQDYKSNMLYGTLLLVGQDPSHLDSNATPMNAQDED